MKAASERPLRVLQVGLERPATRPGGLNRYFSGLCTALVEGGVGVQALTFGRDNSGLPAWWTTAGAMDEPLPRRLLSLYLQARQLRDLEVMDLHFALTALAPMAVRSIRRLPAVVHFQGPWADESGFTGSSVVAQRVKRRVERHVYRRADAHVVLSRAFRRVLVERYGVVPWGVSVIPPAVDGRRFTSGDRLAARSVLGATADCWMVVCVRRLVPRMGIDVLLEAWSDVAAGTDGDVQLVVVGDGPERGALEARAAGLGIADCVQFAGRVDDVELARWYQAADLSVVPTVALEGFGLVVAESLASGTPVVASSVGGLPEALAPLDETLLVPPGDRHGLARRLEGARSGALPVPSREACVAYAQRFSWSEVADRHVDLYRGLLDRRPSGRIRVVVLGHTAQPSGGELAMLRLLGALDQVATHVVLAEDGPLVSLLEKAGISVEVLPMDEGSRRLSRDRVAVGSLPVGAVVATGAYTARLAKRLRTLRPDLVHTNTLKAALYGGVAARMVGIPCLWHIRDRIDGDYLPEAAVRLVRVAARRLPVHVVANSDATLATLRLPAGGGSVVPSPVNVPLAGPVTAGETGDRALRIGMVGRLARWKGQDVFVRAFAQAFPAGAERAVIVGGALFGEEDYEAEVKALACDLGVADRVDFLGFRQDVAAELREFDIFVHASVIAEPFGQVVVEGMAAGLPVVATAGGGPAEIITDRVDGLLYPAADVPALTGLLRQLAGDPLLRRSLGSSAVRTAGRYRPEVIAAEMAEVYRLIFERRPAPTTGSPDVVG